MKKASFYIIMLTVAFSASACSESTEAPATLHQMSFKVSTGSTRTSLENDGSVSWSATDRLSVFDSQGNRLFTTTEEGTEVNFTGQVGDATNYYALYPYQPEASIVNMNEIHALVPYSQKATPDGFAPEVNVSAGTTTAKNASFLMKNVCGLLKFTIPSTLSFMVKEVRIHSHAGEQLAGHINIECGDEPAYSKGTLTGDSIAKTITLTANGASIAPGTYYIACLPQTLEYGFSLTLVETNGNEHIKSTNKPTTIRRSKILNLGTIDAFNIEAVDLGGGVLWANVNVGADKPEDYGNYYAWGETEPKESYDASNYALSYGASNFKKYSLADGLIKLQPEDDAAHVYMGGEWRLPTKLEFDWLTMIASGNKKTLNGVNGFSFSYNGNSIFLPYAGRIQQSAFHEVTTNGAYWFSDRHATIESMGMFVSIINAPSTGQDPRFYGKSIRAVRPKH